MCAPVLYTNIQGFYISRMWLSVSDCSCAKDFSIAIGHIGLLSNSARMEMHIGHLFGFIPNVYVPCVRPVTGQVLDEINRKTRTVVTNSNVTVTYSPQATMIHSIPSFYPLWLRNRFLPSCPISGCFPHPTEPLVNADVAKQR